VKVATGSLVAMEMYQRELKEAGIPSKVVGLNLEASFGTAIPNSIELWVHRSDAERAASEIERLEAERGHRGPEQEEPRHGRGGPNPRAGFTHPEGDPKPRPADPRREPYTNPDPGS
jgi:hypothetical protein